MHIHVYLVLYTFSICSGNSSVETNLMKKFDVYNFFVSLNCNRTKNEI